MNAHHGTTALDTRDEAVDGKGKRSRRKRTTRATTNRRIDAAARARQVTWTETGHPNETERLTQELDGLYGTLRGER